MKKGSVPLAAQVDDVENDSEESFSIEVPSPKISQTSPPQRARKDSNSSKEVEIPIVTNSNSNSSNGRNDAENTPKTPSPPSAFRKWISSVVPPKDYWKSRAFKNVCKSMVAFLVCALCTFVIPIAQLLGDWNFLASAAMIFVDMDQSLGGIFERFWIFVFVMGITFLSTWGTLATSHGQAIMMLSWIVTFTFVMSWMRAKFNVRWTSPITNALEVYFLTVIVGKRRQNTMDFEFETFVLPFGTATMTGVCICLVVTALVFPFSSTQLLQSEIVKTFSNTKKFLDLNLKCFCLEASPKEIAEFPGLRAAVDANSTKLANYLHDAKMEIARSNFTNDQKKKLVFLIRQMLVQSTAMTSCFQKDNANTKKNEVLKKFIASVNPSLKSLIKCLGRAADLLQGFFDKNSSDFDPQVWADLITELDHEVENLREAMSEAAENMSAESPVILSSKGHKRIRSFGNLEHVEMDAILASRTPPSGVNALVQSKTDNENSNSSWEAIFRVNFFVASCDRLTVDYQKTLQYILDLQKKNMGRKMIQLPIWLSKFRFFTDSEPKTKKGAISVKETAPLTSNAAYRTESSETGRGLRRSQSLADSLEESLSDSDAEERERSLRNRFVKLPSVAQLPVAPPRENSKSLGYKVWALSTFFTHTNEVVFAFKTGLAIYFAALLFFLPATADLWNNLRAEWALFTITALTSMTVGGNTLPSLYRVAGTIVGALWAVTSWKLMDGNPYGLFFMCAIFGFPMFHLKLNTAYPRVGSVGLTTFVIILYGKFSGTVVFKRNDVDNIETLALKRSFCILFGILLVFLVNRFVMPHLARRDLRLMISKSLHMSSDLFEMVTSQFLQKDSNSKSLKEANSLAQKIQLQIAEEKGLITQAINEPRLKGPFPHKLYSDYINCIQFILDRTLTLKLIIAGDFSAEVRKSIVNPLNTHRKDMTTTVIMLLWIMAESMRSKVAMPQHLPNAMKARNELISAFQKLPTVLMGEINPDQVEDYLLFCGYIESQKDLIGEIHKMVGLVKLLFGEKKIRSV